MQVIDIFSGIGCFSIAAMAAGWDTIQFCEQDLFCQDILRERFPGIPVHDDIYTLQGAHIPFDEKKPIAVVGGFPCQSFSTAGKGALDLSLWKQMLRIIQQTTPDIVVAENVPGIVGRQRGLAFQTVCADLEAAGYKVTPLNLPAAGKGAPHYRERIWFVAHATIPRLQRHQLRASERKRSSWSVAEDVTYPERSGRSAGTKRLRRPEGTNPDRSGARTEVGTERIPHASNTVGGRSKQVHHQVQSQVDDGQKPDGKSTLRDVAHTYGTGSKRWSLQRSSRKDSPAGLTFIGRPLRTDWEVFPTQSPVCGRSDGPAARMDRAARIKALGNAIYWEVAFEIFKAINDANEK